MYAGATMCAGFLFNYAEFCVAGVAQCIRCSDGVRPHFYWARNNFARPCFADKVIINKPKYCCVVARRNCLERYIGNVAIIGDYDSGVCDWGYNYVCWIGVNNFVQIAPGHKWGWGVARDAGASEHIQVFCVPKFIDRRMRRVWRCVARAQSGRVINRNRTINWRCVNGRYARDKI